MTKSQDETNQPKTPWAEACPLIANNRLSNVFLSSHILPFQILSLVSPFRVLSRIQLVQSVLSDCLAGQLWCNSHGFLLNALPWFFEHCLLCRSLEDDATCTWGSHHFCRAHPHMEWAWVTPSVLHWQAVGSAPSGSGEGGGVQGSIFIDRQLGQHLVEVGRGGYRGVFTDRELGQHLVEVGGGGGTGEYSLTGSWVST